MKGLILAGGNGTRLYPLTQFTNKHLLPIASKPMVYYPLSTMIAAGITQIGMVCRPQDRDLFVPLSKHLTRLGISLELINQEQPNGIADALIAAEKFVSGQKVFLMLGDNILFAIREIKTALDNFSSGAHFFTTYVSKPERFGVAKLNEFGAVEEIVEKPSAHIGNGAVPGLYIYDETLISRCKELKASVRGELEITDLNNKFIACGEANITHLPRSIPWFDAGTHSDFWEASNYVNAVERATQGLLGSPEEIALRRGFVSLDAFTKIISELPSSDYRHQLEQIKL